MENPIAFLAALSKNGVPFESHIYSYAPHGCSLGTAPFCPPSTPMTPRYPHWFADSLGWLREVLGDWKEDGEIGEPSKEATYRIHDDTPFLSRENSMARVYANPEGHALLEPLVAKVLALFHATDPNSFAYRLFVVDGFPLMNVEKGLHDLGLRGEALEALLRRIEQIKA